MFEHEFENEIFEEVNGSEQIECSNESIFKQKQPEPVEILREEFLGGPKMFCKETERYHCDAGIVEFKPVDWHTKVIDHSPDIIFEYGKHPSGEAGCMKYERIVNFDILSMSLLKAFKLERISYEDYVRISINNHQVLNKPFGGNKLDIVNWGVDIGDGDKHRCKLGLKREEKFEIDLMEYVHEGSNELKIENTLSRDEPNYLGLKVEY